MKLTVLTYNTLFGGRDGADDRRAHAQAELLDEVRPDVFLMQEAKGFDAHGGAWLYALEARIGMRGFLAAAPGTGQNVAIFVRDWLRPLSFEADAANFHHALATLRVALPDDQGVLSLISAHLCPNGPEVRRREAACLGILAAPDSLTLLTGDFNSASPHDPQPEGFDALPAHHRSRYLSDDLEKVDHSVMSRLEAAGWIDVAHALGDHSISTVPAASFMGTEFPAMRCDYVLASRALAAFARTCQVIRTPATDMASDHYPVLATFDINR